MTTRSVLSLVPCLLLAAPVGAGAACSQTPDYAPLYQINGVITGSGGGGTANGSGGSGGGGAGGANPPPVSGGTLMVMPDGNTAVAADPDRDRVWIVDLRAQVLLHEVVLQAGDEPGRVVADAAGGVHVALRSGGALVSIDSLSGAVTARRPVCPAPRGVAYEVDTDEVHVACADGRLVSFPAAGGAAVRSVYVDSDLRDVVVQNGTLYVSRFRAAEILQLAADGTLSQRITLPSATPVASGLGGSVPAATGPTMVPSVAYRMVALPGGQLALLHQRAQQDPVSIMPGGYASSVPCTGIVHDTLTIVAPGVAPIAGPPLGMMVLAVDVAASPDGSQLTVASPSSVTGPPVGTYSTASVQQPGAPCALPATPSIAGGQVIAVAYDGGGDLVVQSRDPATLTTSSGGHITLSQQSVINDGHTIFHQGTKGFIACASCHPEAGDDGRVWQFDDIGPRRTQNLRGGVLARVPFHWSGDIPDMDALVTEVLVGRMSGPSLDEPSILALGAWMNAQPALAPPPPADPAAVARGATTFADPSVGCSGCHSGPQLSTHQLIDVGTGGPFKVPSLIAVGYRAPYLHTGCAPTLTDRFTDTACSGGEMHGNTAQLGAGQISDLVAFLTSL
jgi:hypothetical protein